MPFTNTTAKSLANSLIHRIKEIQILAVSVNGKDFYLAKVYIPPGRFCRRGYTLGYLSRLSSNRTLFLGDFNLLLIRHDTLIKRRTEDVYFFSNNSSRWLSSTTRRSPRDRRVRDGPRHNLMFPGLKYNSAVNNYPQSLFMLD